jgi:hypothetical protein
MRGTPSICMTDSPGGAALIEPGAARAASVQAPQAIRHAPLAAKRPRWWYRLEAYATIAGLSPAPLRRHRVLRVRLDGSEAGRNGERRAGVAGGVRRVLLCRHVNLVV